MILYDMPMIRLILFVISSLVFSAAPTFGADQQKDTSTLSPSWTGIYIGGLLGYGWARANWTSISAPSPVPDFSSGDHITSHQVNGVFGGGYLGLNYQLGSLVFGIEPSYSGGTLSGDSKSNRGSADDKYSTRINHLFSTTMRAGYATDKWFTYLRVGYASGNVKTRFVDALGAEQGSGHNDERHHGFQIGPGLEYRITPNVIIGSEYNYLDLGSSKQSIGDLGSGLGPVINKIDPKGIHQLLLRLSYLVSW